MNLWLSIVLAVAALLSLVFCIEKQMKDTILESYVHPRQIREMYIYFEDETKKINGTNPCMKTTQLVRELDDVNHTSLDIRSEIIFGDFNDTTGYDLILDELTTIDIPAILKCTPKYKNGDPVIICGIEVIYYLVLYLHEEGLYFRRAYRSEHIRGTNLRPTFLITDARTIEYFLMTYSDDNARQTVIDSLNKSKFRGKEICTDLANVGMMSEGSVTKWKIINGVIKTGTYILHLKLNTTVELPKIVECKVKVQNLSSKTRDPKTAKKYFAVAKRNNDQGNSAYSYLYGPKIDANKIEHFYINLELLDALQNSKN